MEGEAIRATADWWARGLGAAALVIAAIGLIWNIWSAVWRDRPLLKLRIDRGQLLRDSDGDQLVNWGVEGDVLFARAVNRGRRPLRVLSGGLQSGEKKLLVKGGTLPATLGESEEITLWIERGQLATELQANAGGVPTQYWFLDSGQQYHRGRIPPSLRQWMRGLM